MKRVATGTLIPLFFIAACGGSGKLASLAGTTGLTANKTTGSSKPLAQARIKSL